MYPLNQAFDWDAWQEGFNDHWSGKGQLDEMREVFKQFKNEVLKNFAEYQVFLSSRWAPTHRMKPSASSSRRSTPVARRSTPSSS